MNKTIETIDTVVNTVPRAFAAWGDDIAGAPGRFTGFAAGYLLEVGAVGLLPWVGGIASTAVMIASPATAIYRNVKGE